MKPKDEQGKSKASLKNDERNKEKRLASDTVGRANRPGTKTIDRPDGSQVPPRPAPVLSEVSDIDEEDEEEEVGRGFNRPSQQRDEGQNRANVDASRQRESTGQGSVRHRKAPTPLNN